MSRKILSIVLIVLLAVGLVPSISAQEEEVSIRYFTFSAAPDHLEDLDTIIAAFNEEYPHITVEVATAPYDDYFTLLQADFAGNQPPDVFELNYENFVSYAANDTMLDLSSYLSADAPFYPAALEAFNYDGQQLALPATFSTVLLFYNSSLFDEAGLEYPTAEWTWDDALAAAQAIRALGDDIYGLYSPIQFHEFYKKAAQNGCAFFNDDMTESTINSEACVDTLNHMVNFISEDVMPDPIEMSGISDSELFLSGNLGMVVTGIWMFAAFAEAPFDWDVEIEPGFQNKAHHFFSNGVAVARNTEHPEAAAAWAQFLASSETAAQVRVDSAWELPALNEPAYFEAYLSQTPPENREAVFTALESPVTPPVIERQSEMQDTVTELLAAVQNGELDAQTALDLAKDELDSFIAE